MLLSQLHTNTWFYSIIQLSMYLRFTDVWFNKTTKKIFRFYFQSNFRNGKYKNIRCYIEIINDIVHIIWTSLSINLFILILVNYTWIHTDSYISNTVMVHHCWSSVYTLNRFIDKILSTKISLVHPKCKIISVSLSNFAFSLLISLKL